MSINPKTQSSKETQFLNQEQCFKDNFSLEEDELEESLTEFQPLQGPNSKMLEIDQEKQKMIYLQPGVRRSNKDKFKKQQNLKKQMDPMRKSKVDPKGCLKREYLLTTNNQIQSAIHNDPNHSLECKEKYYNQTSKAPFPIPIAITHQLDSLKLAKNEKDRLDVIIGTNQPKQISKPTIMCQFCPAFFNYKSYNTYSKHVNTQHINDIKDIWPKCQVCSTHLKNSNALTKHCLRAHKLRDPTQSLKNQHKEFVLPRDLENNLAKSPTKYTLSSNQDARIENIKKINVQSLHIKTPIKVKSLVQKNNAAIPTALSDISNKHVPKEEVKRLDIISKQEEAKSLAMSNVTSNLINIQLQENLSKFSCKTCTKEFDKENEYKAHVNKMHKFLCRFCHQQFENLIILSQHYLDVHAPKNTNDSKSPRKKQETKQQIIAMDDQHQSLKVKAGQFDDQVLRKRIKFELVDNTKEDSSEKVSINEIYKTNFDKTSQVISQINLNKIQAIHTADDKESEENSSITNFFDNRGKLLSLGANAKEECELFPQSSPQYQPNEVKQKTTSEQDSSNLSEQTIHILNKEIEANQSGHGLRNIRKIERSINNKETKPQNLMDKDVAENFCRISNSTETIIKIEELSVADESKNTICLELGARKRSSESGHSIQKVNNQDSKERFSQILNTKKKSDKIAKLTTSFNSLESTRELRARKHSPEIENIPKVFDQDSITKLGKINNSNEKLVNFEKMSASDETKSKSSLEPTTEVRIRKPTSESDNIQKSLDNLKNIFSQKITIYESKTKFSANIRLPELPRQLRARKRSSESEIIIKRKRIKLNLISTIAPHESSTPSQNLEQKTNARQTRSSNTEHVSPTKRLAIKSVVVKNIKKKNAGCPKSKRKFMIESATNQEVDDLMQSLPSKKQKSHINLGTNFKITLLEGLFGCKFCSIVLRRAVLLERHTVIVHKDQKIPVLHCTQCDIKFEAVFLNRQHTQLFHSKVQVKVLDIPLAKDKANDSINLDRSVDSKKTSIDWNAFVYEQTAEILKCKLCEKEYSSKGYFKSHLKRVHFQEKISCSFCEETFTSKASHKKHSLTHQLEPKLECSQCPRLFKNKFGLNYHLEKYHNIIVESPKLSVNVEPKSDNSFIAQPFSPPYQQEEEEGFFEKMMFDHLDKTETDIDPDLSIQVLEDLVNESINSSTPDQQISNLLSSLNIPESELEDSFMESDLENSVTPGSNEHTERDEKSLEYSDKYSISTGESLVNKNTGDPEQSTLDEILNHSLAIEADFSYSNPNDSVDSGINQMVYHQDANEISNDGSTNAYSKEEEEEFNKSLSSLLHMNKNFFDILNLNN